MGLEGEGELITQPARVRSSYLKELEAFVARVKRACNQADVDYVLVNTADPIEHVLTSYLLQRTALSKVR